MYQQSRLILSSFEDIFENGQSRDSAITDINFTDKATFSVDLSTINSSFLAKLQSRNLEKGSGRRGRHGEISIHS